MHVFVIMGMLFVLAVVDPGAEHFTPKDLSNYLPDSGFVNGWRSAHTPQTFVGDSLYDYINGGASIYYEYGFKQVITQQYANADSQYLTLELYEMKNSAAAFGMYTYKTGTSGKKIDIGSDAMLEDYYLNFWKDRFVCTVTGFGSGQENEEALLMLARVVAERIADEAQPPYIVGLFPTDSLHHPSIMYVKGILGLSRYYTFDGDGFFEITEAALADYGDHQVFVFKYRDVKQCLGVFLKVQDHFRNNPAYSDHVTLEGAFSILDDKEQHLHFTLFEQYLFVYIGTGEHDPAVLFETIRNNIK